MSTSRVLQLRAFRTRLERLVERATVLYGADEDRASLVPHLYAAITAAAGDRGGLIWVDEYGPGLAHTHLVLDLTSELPRRTFPIEPLRLAWAAGVPGLYDLPGSEASKSRATGGRRSLCAVSLGSDGIRAWFLVVDGQNPRGPLGEDASGRVMFSAGECSSVVMHRDLQRSTRTLLTPEGGSDRFTGWPILKDLDGCDPDDALSRRISSRFLVARVVRTVVDQDLTTDPETLAQQVSGVRRELDGSAARDREFALWCDVLDAVSADDWAALLGTLLALAGHVEDQGHFSGARELYRSAYEIAMATGDDQMAMEGARLSGRACRRQAEWDRALDWYAVARGLAVAMDERGREALILDGVASIHRERGSLPRAREVLQEALQAALASGDREAETNVYQDLMAVSGLVGDHDSAIRFGWNAVQAPREEEDRLKALAGLAWAFVLAGDFQAAEDAYVIVAKGVRRLEHRLYALSGYTQVAGLRGHGTEFRARLGRLEAEGFERGSVKFRAEAHLELGQVFLALDDCEEAERRFRLALTLSQEHKLNQLMFKAEEALDALDVGRETNEDEPRAVPASSEEVDEIRGELAAMREAVGTL